MIAVAAVQKPALGSENNIIEIYDTVNDYERVSTVLTYHTAPITCLTEHRKLLLSGSSDCSIGFWDISNNY